jgi:hypothetical protein
LSVNEKWLLITVLRRSSDLIGWRAAGARQQGGASDLSQDS